MKKVLHILILFAFFSSCSKFEDGPKFSIFTEKMRLTGNWEVDMVYDVKTNESITANYYSSTLVLKKDETYSKTFIYNLETFTKSGNWNKNNDSIQFVHIEYNTEYTESFKILRLTNKELWISDDKREFHYKKQK